MKHIYWVIACLLFGMCSQREEVSLLPETMSKPTSKKTVTLNSERNGNWTQHFGVQDKEATIISTERFIINK